MCWTLDEAIEYAEKEEKHHRQIAEWLKDYKRLLEGASCEDAISRQAVLALAEEECETAIIPYRRFVKCVNALPSVTPQSKIGQWDPKIDFDDTHYGYICHSCNLWVRDKTDYCPNCGAKMRIGEE